MIDILEFNPTPLDFWCTGLVKTRLLVKFHESNPDTHIMELYCKVMVRSDRLGFWVRMPKDLLSVHDQNSLRNCCNWPDLDSSNNFQVEVLLQLRKRFPEAIVIPDIEVIKKKRAEHRKKYPNKNKKAAEGKKPFVKDKKTFTKSPQTFSKPEPMTVFRTGKPKNLSKNI